jgi:hypothetical protein
MLPVMLVGLVYWLVNGVARLFTRRSPRWTPWAHFSVLTGTILIPYSFGQPHNPIRAEDEPAYLRFAAAAREALISPELGGSISLDDTFVNASESASTAETRRRLASMLPAYWPRQWLHVYLDGKTVVLDRGGGFGSVGIRIYASSDSHSRNDGDEENDSGARRVSDHVWFFVN